MNSPAIAVVVPVYNRATAVLHTLDSVARQTHRPHRLVVVDDGSTDRTGESVERWLDTARPPFTCQLIRQANGGVSSARNHGLKHATDCPFVSFLDSDDLWPADFLARTSAVLNTKPDVIACSCDRTYLDEHGRCQRSDALSAMATDATRWLFEHDGGIASCTLFRADSIRRLGGFDEELSTGEDSELFLRLSQLGPWRHAPGAAVIFQSSIADIRQEQRRLSQSYADSQRTWAEIHEEFIFHNGGRNSLPPSLYRDRLARRWYWAGRQLMHAGRNVEARACFRRSLAWKIWKCKAWFRLLRTFLPSAA